MTEHEKDKWNKKTVSSKECNLTYRHWSSIMLLLRGDLALKSR
jgi:hypothetical protein